MLHIIEKMPTKLRREAMGLFMNADFESVTTKAASELSELKAEDGPDFHTFVQLLTRCCCIYLGFLGASDELQEYLRDLIHKTTDDL